jgi:integrase
MPNRIALLADAWPERDRDAWHRAITPVDYFDEEAVAAHWSEKTRYQAQAAYGRWLAFVHDHLHSVFELSPRERMDAERGRQYVEHIGTRISDMGISSELGHLILALRAIAPEADCSWLRNWQYAYQRRAIPREKRNKIVHPLRLIKLGRDLMDTADERGQRLERGRQFRDGLLITLLASRPMRRRALSALRINLHVRKNGDTFTIVIPGADTKSGQPTEMPLPGWLTPYLTRYLEQYRTLFPCAETDDHLWLSSKGGGLGAEAIYSLVCQRTEQGLGVAISPHLFRDIAATMIAREAPQSLPIARDLLTHANVDTTVRHYTQANTLAAARAYQKALDRR